MTITSTIILLSYLILIVVFTKGWSDIPTFRFREHTNSTEGISVVVACRNESDRLPDLLESLKTQSYQTFQLVLVDDNSTDDTLELMRKASINFKNCKVLQSGGYGKKQALKSGIESCDYELIATTDADCTPTPLWLECIVKFQSQSNSDLIIGPVAISPAKKYFEKLQQLEFLSLVSAGAGAVGIENPIMCNGANLAFKKEKWLQNFSYIQENLYSGDDVFMLHALKAQHAKISFLKSTESIVNTVACHSPVAFFRQRTRWASKTPAYTDFLSISVAIVVFLTALVQIVFLLAGIFNHFFLLLYLGILITKLLVDIRFLAKTAVFFGQKITAKTILPLAVLYPFYILIASISGIFTGLKNYR